LKNKKIKRMTKLNRLGIDPKGPIDKEILFFCEQIECLFCQSFFNKLTPDDAKRFAGTKFLDLQNECIFYENREKN
jgi:hypothetical protein